MTLQLYLKDTYLFHSEGLILKTGEDEKGHFVILDQTVFYPQGGGQPSDQGVIKSDSFQVNVTSVRQVDADIRHYITLPQHEIQINSRIECFVDQERRILNSRYHTAGHLVHNIVEMVYPSLKTIKGHSFPGEAYLELQGHQEVDPVNIQATIDEAIFRNDKINIFEIDPDDFERKFYDLPYSIPKNKKFRVMQIGDMFPIPCGGTHLASLGELGRVSVGKIKAKNNMVRVSYELV